ncbi:MAG TPA: ROK family protein, partial [Ilumatobacteraceae bacterium]
MAHQRLSFGIDIGGTGMKAAPVDLDTGELAGARYRIDTPRPAVPETMAAVARELVQHFGWSGPIGVAMPSVVRHGVIYSAANIDPSWIGVDADALFTEATGCSVSVLNDADAAGVAEMRFGAGRGRSGVVIMLTFGTGIGSGMFNDGRLVPNTELGHLEIDGHDAESRAAASARKRDSLSWKEWAQRVDRYLAEIVKLFSPELVIAGGGA